MKRRPHSALGYHVGVPVSPLEPDLPDTMTWEELERLPEEIAEQIELWEGRVVWTGQLWDGHVVRAHGGSAEHQIFTGRLRSALERCVRKDMSIQNDRCWRANFETNVFFGTSGKSDFVTPDFLVHRCLDAPYQDVRSNDVLLIGEVLPPSNTTDIETKRARYAKGGIPWYWEVILARDDSAIDAVRVFALETSPGPLPNGVQPMHRANYLLVDEWTHAHENGVEINYPFPISIPWSELEF